MFWLSSGISKRIPPGEYVGNGAEFSSHGCAISTLGLILPWESMLNYLSWFSSGECGEYVRVQRFGIDNLTQDTNRQ